jgi:hypothetical protein
MLIQLDSNKAVAFYKVYEALASIEAELPNVCFIIIIIIISI